MGINSTEDIFKKNTEKNADFTLFFSDNFATHYFKYSISIIKFQLLLK